MDNWVLKVDRNYFKIISGSEMQKKTVTSAAIKLYHYQLNKES